MGAARGKAPDVSPDINYSSLWLGFGESVLWQGQFMGRAARLVQDAPVWSTWGGTCPGGATGEAALLCRYRREIRGYSPVALLP